MTSEGVEVDYLSDEELVRFKEATAGVWDQMKDTIDPTIYDMAVAIRG